MAPIPITLEVHERFAASSPAFVASLRKQLRERGIGLAYDDFGVGQSRLVELSFVSCHSGHRKPSPRAFLGACEQLGLAPTDCLFVDDRSSNVQAADALGMPALHFSGDVGRLREQLVDFGQL